MKKVMISAVAITLFSCNSQKSPQADYEIKTNETFELALKANPTTGYSWKLKKDGAAKLVDSVSAIYTQDQSNEVKAGVGGNEVWKFKGKTAGVDTLTLEYCRSWEPNSTIETKKFVVKVK